MECGFWFAVIDISQMNKTYIGLTKSRIEKDIEYHWLDTLKDLILPCHDCDDFFKDL